VFALALGLLGSLVPCLQGVKSGKARGEHIPSGLPPRADIVDAFWHFRFVPEATFLRHRRDAEVA
jgi:hypothetical protein